MSGRYKFSLTFFEQHLHQGDGPDSNQPTIAAAWFNICSNLAVTYKKLDRSEAVRDIVTRCLRAPCFIEPTTKVPLLASDAQGLASKSYTSFDIMSYRSLSCHIPSYHSL
jgi:hypothetical protein